MTNLIPQISWDASLVPCTTSTPLLTDPSAAVSLMRQEIDLENSRLALVRDVARMDLLRQTSADHASEIIAFIQKNSNDNVFAEVETEGTAERDSFWGGAGQRIHMKTTFRGSSR